MEFIIYILAVYGMTYIITKSFLFQSFRDLFIKHKYLSYLVNCPVCMGFWVALIIYFLPFNFILYPLAGSAICNFIQTLIDLLDSLNKDPFKTK